MCERCNNGRRNAVEIIDPVTEEPVLLCQRCAKNVALGRLFKRREARHVHADDAGLIHDRDQPMTKIALNYGFH